MSHHDRRSKYSRSHSRSPKRNRDHKRSSSPPRSSHYEKEPYKKYKTEDHKDNKDHKSKTEPVDDVDLHTEKIQLSRDNPAMREISETNALENFKISSEAVKHLKSIGITYLFPIQAATFEHVVGGKDLVARDRTGSGKTLSYALPIVEKFRKKDYFRRKEGQKPLALVVLPTRELAIQVTNVFNTIRLNDREFRILSVYGGTEIRAQIEDAKKGVEIIVGTPGRLLDLIDRKAFSLSKIKIIVLDEADQMLDMGFQEDIEKIYDKIKEEKEEEKDLQSLLFSATIPKWVHEVSKKYLREDIVHIDLLKDSGYKTPSTVKHLAVSCPYFSRMSAIGDLVLCYGGKHARTIIFAETKKEANDVMLEAHIKQECQVLHGDIPQKQREITFRAFREGKFKCLIATNVAARGLDIPEVDLILQLQPPKDVDTYVHRAGRTARAGRTGVCVTFYNKKQVELLERIERSANLKFQRVGAPQPMDIIKATSRDVVTSIRHVPGEVVSVFKDIAKDLVKDLGPEEALCRALAIISGTNEKFKQRSLLSSIEGFITYLVETDAEFRHNAYIWTFLRKYLPDDVVSSIKGLRSYKNKKGAAFDVPEEFARDMTDLIEDGKGESRGFTVKRAEQLPELEDEGGYSGGGGYNRPGDRRDFSRNDRGDRDSRDHRSRGTSSRGNDDRKVFVGGLSYDADESDIKDFFKKEDLRPEEVILLKDDNGKSKGSAFVVFSRPEKAEKAAKLSGEKIRHRAVRIELANRKR